MVSNPSRGTCAFGPWASNWMFQALWPSQTPLGERVPSASMDSAALGHPIGCLKPLSGNVCLRPQDLGPSVSANARVSNPSRGTCAFGRGTRAANPPRARGLKPLSGNVCLRPKTADMSRSWCSGVSNPSRGTCAFGRSRRPHKRGASLRLKPLSGNVCLRPRRASFGLLR